MMQARFVLPPHFAITDRQTESNGAKGLRCRFEIIAFTPVTPRQHLPAMADDATCAAGRFRVRPGRLDLVLVEADLVGRRGFPIWIRPLLRAES
jgi:hypothetical protein